MTTVPNDGEVRIVCQAYGCAWTPSALRQIYDEIIALWTEVGVPPDRLATKAPGIGKNWKTFKGRRKKFEQTNFGNIEYFCLSHLAEPNDDYPTKNHLYPDRDWLVYANVSIRDQRIELGWIPEYIASNSALFLDFFRRSCEIGWSIYGFKVRRCFYFQSHTEMIADTPMKKALRFNAQEWGMRIHRKSFREDNDLLFANIFTHNYLSAAYLDAPFGRTAMTLREWIEDEPQERGGLRPFTDILTEWAPPVENIPKLREQLFRAGRLFYHRFFRELDYDSVVLPSGEIVPRDYLWKNNIRLPGQAVYPPEPFYRPDIHAPWEWTGPIPEIFRAEYYKDKDPGLIY